jgi:hypothetical protein
MTFSPLFFIFIICAFVKEFQPDELVAPGARYATAAVVLYALLLLLLLLLLLFSIVHLTVRFMVV